MVTQECQAVGYLAAYYQQAPDSRKLPDSSYCLLLRTLKVHLTWGLGEFPCICSPDVQHWLVVVADQFASHSQPVNHSLAAKIECKNSTRTFCLSGRSRRCQPCFIFGKSWLQLSARNWLSSWGFLWQMSGEYLKLGVWPLPSLSFPIHH
jgi:hypothetical protein